MPTIVHVADRHGYRKTESFDEIAELLSREETTVWIDADARTPELVRLLEKELGIHPMAIEDIFEERTTPKVEDYGTYLYVVMHAVRRDSDDPESLATTEIDLVFGSNWIFTQHTVDAPWLDEVGAELARNPRVLQRGAAWAAHAVIDRLTDQYLPIVDRFDVDIDELEKTVVSDPKPELLSHLFAMKHALQRLRRLSIYQRDILQRLSRGEFELVPERALPFYRDVHDHFVHVADLADSHRELISTALEMYLSVTANRTNEIMKVLAVISTLMLPLSFIAGVYGMNFERMPELKWRYGYVFALSLMASVVIGLMAFFKKRKWI